MNKMIRILTGCALAAACAGCEFFGEKQLTLTADNAEVVVAADATPVAKFAAAEMTNFLSQAFGRAVPLVAKPSPGKVAVEIGGRGEGLAPDAYRLTVRGNRIGIVGRDDPKVDPAQRMRQPSYSCHCFDKGTLNGVYAFLERFAGCRFYFPGRLGEVVPRTNRIVVPEQDAVDAPDMTVRTWSFFSDGKWPGAADAAEGNRQKALNLFRLRATGGGFACCHGLNGFRYKDRFLKTHPEYFALAADGKTRGVNLCGQDGQLCFTSAITNEIFKDCLSFLKGEPASVRGIPGQKPGTFAWGYNCTKGYIDIMPQDGMMRCHCKNCEAAYDKGDDRNYATSLIWGYTDAIAKRLKAEGFEPKLQQMAYTPYRRLPSFHLSTNISVMVAETGPFSICNEKSVERQRKEVADWSERVGREVWMWTYPNKHDCNHLKIPDIPCWCPRAWGKYYKTMAPRIYGGFCESECDRAVYNLLAYYVFSKLAWDKSVDTDALVDEFYAKMFGAAGEPMKRFGDLLEAKWTKEIAGAQRDTPLGPAADPPDDFRLWTGVYDEKTMAELEGLLRTAAAAVTSVNGDSVWFDTNHKPTSDTVSQIKFTFTKDGGAGLYGYLSPSADDGTDYRLAANNGKWMLDLGDNKKRIGQSGAAAACGTATANVENYLEIGNYYIKDLAADETLASVTPVTFSRDYTLRIFGKQAGYAAYGSVASLKIFEKGTLVHDFVPCVSPEGVTGLFDLCTSYFHKPDGTFAKVEGGDEPALTPVAAPTAVTGLKYTGKQQTGVAAATGYTVTGGAATDAGDYTATATLADGYKWSDGTTGAKDIAWSIAKGVNTWKTNPSVSPATWSVDAVPGTITIANGATAFGATVTCDTTVAALKALGEGDHTVTFTAAAGGDNYDAITKTVTVTVTAGEAPGPGPTPGEGVPVLTAPADGATVAMLTDRQKQAIAHGGESWDGGNLGDNKAHPVVLSWTGTTGPVRVTVVRVKDGSTLIDETTDAGTLDAYNMLLGEEYRWTVTTASGSASRTFTVELQAPRVIMVQATNGTDIAELNMRDLGGWVGKDGHRVKQGLLYRSRKLSDPYPAGYDPAAVDGRGYPLMSDAAIFVLANRFGIRTELDFRSQRDQARGIVRSVLGPDVEYINQPMLQPEVLILQSSVGNSMLKANMDVIFNRSKYPLDFHCKDGNSRTGGLAYYLLGLLGVDIMDAAADYMWTKYAVSGKKYWADTDFRHMYANVTTNHVFTAADGTVYDRGTSFMNVCESFTLANGYTMEEIEAFREFMLEGYQSGEDPGPGPGPGPGPTPVEGVPVLTAPAEGARIDPLSWGQQLARATDYTAPTTADFSRYANPVHLEWTGTTGPAEVTVCRASDGHCIWQCVSETGSCDAYNCYIGEDHVWTVRTEAGSASGHFTVTQLAPRIIYTHNSEGCFSNMRDEGGYRGLGGRRVRQGLIYRSCQFDSQSQGGTGGSGSTCSSGSCDSAATTEAQKIVTPAIAKSIAGDTARAQEAQAQERQRAYGISSTYNRYKNKGQESGNTTLGGS